MRTRLYRIIKKNVLRKGYIKRSYNNIAILRSPNFSFECKVIAYISDKIKIEIRTKEANHNIPHFHAKNNEYSGSFRIIDASQLAGNFPKRLQKIIKTWSSHNRLLLISTWLKYHGTFNNSVVKSIKNKRHILHRTINRSLFKL